MARYIDADKLNTRERGNNSQRTMWHEIKRIVADAPTADVVPKSEVAKEICCEIEEEIVAALESNYRALKELDDGRCNEYIIELVSRIKGKIDALRGIESFVEELKKKYTVGRMMEKSCETCAYYDEDRNDQPCCSCFNLCNWEKEEKRCTDCKYFVGCECFSGMTCDEYTERKEDEGK